MVASVASRGAPVAVLAAFVAVAMAGCADSPEPEPAGDDPFAGLQDEVEVTATLGAIVGVVVDQAIRPLANATIALTGQAGNTTTDDQGRFTFGDLEPGTYFLQASARRHEAAQVSVDVVAGEAAIVRILLIAMTSVEPYHTTLNFHGHADPWFGFVSFAAEVIAPGTLGCTCAFEVVPDPGAVSFTFEAVGTNDIDYSSSPVYGNLYWEFVGDALGEHQDIRSAHGSFPIYQTFERDSFDNETETWLARITPGQFVHTSMDYDIFLTIWYHEPMPDGWSFVAGDT